MTNIAETSQLMQILALRSLETECHSHWTTINEANVFALGGYDEGISLTYTRNTTR